MHLWPSLRIRDSFKHAYLAKLDYNLHRMKRSRATSSKSAATECQKDPLLGSGDSGDTKPLTLLGFCWDLLFLLSCCCCCFCCGVCHDEDEHSTIS